MQWVSHLTNFFLLLSAKQHKAINPLTRPSCQNRPTLLLVCIYISHGSAVKDQRASLTTYYISSVDDDRASTFFWSWKCRLPYKSEIFLLFYLLQNLSFTSSTSKFVNDHLFEIPTTQFTRTAVTPFLRKIAFLWQSSKPLFYLIFRPQFPTTETLFISKEITG